MGSGNGGSTVQSGNLVVFADCNGFQSGGRVDEISTLYPLLPKWRAFVWHCQEIAGHSMEPIVDTVDCAKENTKKPSFIGCKTIKGIPFMEHDNSWHKRFPTEDELKKAIISLRPNRLGLSSHTLS